MTGQEPPGNSKSGLTQTFKQLAASMDNFMSDEEKSLTETMLNYLNNYMTLN